MQILKTIDLQSIISVGWQEMEIHPINFLNGFYSSY